jgi:hypothetical protein
MGQISLVHVSNTLLVVALTNDVLATSYGYGSGPRSIRLGKVCVLYLKSTKSIVGMAIDLGRPGHEPSSMVFIPSHTASNAIT